MFFVSAENRAWDFYWETTVSLLSFIVSFLKIPLLRVASQYIICVCNSLLGAQIVLTKVFKNNCQRSSWLGNVTEVSSVFFWVSDKTNRQGICVILYWYKMYICKEYIKYSFVALTVLRIVVYFRFFISYSLNKYLEFSNCIGSISV